MKVVAAVNGTITAESMAFYALRYAQVQNLTLVLLHVENKKDDISDVEASMERISTVAASVDVQTERVLLQGSSKRVIKNFLSDIYTDVIFCSTRKYKSLITNSFSETLINMNLNVDVAIVRIVDINHIMDIGNILLSIKEDRLSVKKFTFFATLASAYEAETEIYSVTSMSKRELSSVDVHEAKIKLGAINYNLRHYVKLAYYMPFTLRIKHTFTENEAQSILSHIAKSGAKLAIIGAQRLSFVSFFNREMPIEKLMRESPINMIAYYPRED